MLLRPITSPHLHLDKLSASGLSRARAPRRGLAVRPRAQQVLDSETQLESLRRLFLDFFGSKKAQAKTPSPDKPQPTVEASAPGQEGSATPPSSNGAPAAGSTPAEAAGQETHGRGRAAQRQEKQLPGVFMHASGNFGAKVQIHGVILYCGSHKEEEGAAITRDQAIWTYKPNSSYNLTSHDTCFPFDRRHKLSYGEKYRDVPPPPKLKARWDKKMGGKYIG